MLILTLLLGLIILPYCCAALHCTILYFKRFDVTAVPDGANAWFVRTVKPSSQYLVTQQRHVCIYILHPVDFLLVPFGLNVRPKSCTEADADSVSNVPGRTASRSHVCKNSLDSIAYDEALCQALLMLGCHTFAATASGLTTIFVRFNGAATGASQQRLLLLVVPQDELNIADDTSTTKEAITWIKFVGF